MPPVEMLGELHEGKSALDQRRLMHEALDKAAGAILITHEGPLDNISDALMVFALNPDLWMTEAAADALRDISQRELGLTRREIDDVKREGDQTISQPPN